MAARRFSGIPEVVIALLITRQMERTSKGTQPITKNPFDAVAAAPCKASGLVQIRTSLNIFLSRRAARRRQRHTARMQSLSWMREKASTSRLVHRSLDPGHALLLLQNLVFTGCAED
jgi:hypothetical protein